MKHLKIYEELSDWTKKLLGLDNIYHVYINSYAKNLEEGEFKKVESFIKTILSAYRIDFIVLEEMNNGFIAEFPKSIKKLFFDHPDLFTDDESNAKFLSTWEITFYPDLYQDPSGSYRYSDPSNPGRIKFYYIKRNRRMFLYRNEKN